MTRGCSFPRHPAARQARSAWTLLRYWTRLLSLVAGCLSLLGPSRLRREALRAAGKDLGKLEQILRSLLLLMRVPAAPPRALPFTPQGQSARRNPVRRRIRFSITLRQFSWAPALAPPRPPPVSRSPAARGRFLSDPAAALKLRLDAMRAVYADPARFAARMSAAIGAHCLRLRAPKTLLPAPDLWCLGHIRTGSFTALRLAARLDTS